MNHKEQKIKVLNHREVKRIYPFNKYGSFLLHKINSGFSAFGLYEKITSGKKQPTMRFRRWWSESVTNLPEYCHCAEFRLVSPESGNTVRIPASVKRNPATPASGRNSEAPDSDTSRPVLADSSISGQILVNWLDPVMES